MPFIMAIIGFAKIFAVLYVFLLYGPFPSIEAEKHSLYYIYTALSKPVDLPGIYKFTAMGLLDDRQIDYYNSKEQRKIPTQPWMKKKLTEDYWEKGTRSRKSKEQWFDLSLKTVIDRMRQSESDLHVLQERVGCEVEKQGGEVKFLKGVSEYGYDGENFLSFDDKESQWVALVAAALPTKRKWDNVPILNQNTKGYLEKECLDWLNKFRKYGDQELRNGSPPDVYVFVKRSTSDESKLKLACLATGFYPKDVMMTIRKYYTSLPEDEIESSGIRPNHDGSFQMRKSVVIKEEKAEYDCFVFHSSLKEPMIIKWDGNCLDCPSETDSFMTGAVIGGVLMLAVSALVVVILKKKRITVFKSRNIQEPDDIFPTEVPLREDLVTTTRKNSFSADSGLMTTTRKNSFSTDSGRDTATGISDSLQQLQQDSGLVTTTRKSSFSTDSGRDTASEKDVSVIGSREDVNHLYEDNQTRLEDNPYYNQTTPDTKSEEDL